MARRPKPLFDDSRRQPLRQGDIPPYLAARGWHMQSAIYAHQPSSPAGAWVGEEADVDDRGQRFLFWTGGIAAPRRQLRVKHYDAISAMRAVELAEEDGPMSEDWRDERGNRRQGIPGFTGWDHQVRNGRHVWTRLCCNRPMIVFQLPPERSPRLSFSAWVDGLHVSKVFDDPADAIRAAESEMRSQDRIPRAIAPVANQGAGNV